MKSCVLIVVEVDELDELDDDDVLTALEGTAVTVRNLKKNKTTKLVCYSYIFNYRVVIPGIADALVER